VVEVRDVSEVGALELRRVAEEVIANNISDRARVANVRQRQPAARLRPSEAAMWIGHLPSKGTMR